MDIKTSKGLAQSSNEELRAWTDKGWEQAMREGNYDRSREHLNFEIQRGWHRDPNRQESSADKTYGRKSCLTWHQRPQRGTG